MNNNGTIDPNTEINQINHYYPFGLNMEGNWNGASAEAKNKYQYNGKELQSDFGLDWNDYGARYYDAAAPHWVNIDPLSEKYISMSPYHYVENNPIKLIDPDGRSSSSTDVKKNKDGSYTVVGAKNDGDNNVYVVNDKSERTGQVIAQTITPYDFMGTNDGTGEFVFDPKSNAITFDLDKMGINGTIKGSGDYKDYYWTFTNADGNEIGSTMNKIYGKMIENDRPLTFYGALETLKKVSANGAILDIKVSLGLPVYTAVDLGKTSEGKKLITTLRALSNIAFGTNMRSSKPPGFTEGYYYRKVMEKAGAYNQSQNNGNGYNSGFPYFGEHTYSGSFIYMGYFKKLP